MPCMWCFIILLHSACASCNLPCAMCQPLGRGGSSNTAGAAFTGVHGPYLPFAAVPLSITCLTARQRLNEHWRGTKVNSLPRYGYYLATSLGMRAAAVKPLITQAQMVQFLLFISQARPACPAWGIHP